MSGRSVKLGWSLEECGAIFRDLTRCSGTSQFSSSAPVSGRAGDALANLGMAEEIQTARRQPRRRCRGAAARTNPAWAWRWVIGISSDNRARVGEGVVLKWARRRSRRSGESCTGAAGAGSSGWAVASRSSSRALLKRVCNAARCGSAAMRAWRCGSFLGGQLAEEQGRHAHLHFLIRGRRMLRRHCLTSVFSSSTAMALSA